MAATSTEDESATEPLPDNARVELAPTDVPPVKVLTPVRVWTPPAIRRLPPVPPPAPPSARTPAKPVEPAVIWSRCAPRSTVPAPVRVVIDAPADVWEMSKTPLSSTTADEATDPVPASDRLAPLETSVVPV